MNIYVETNFFLELVFDQEQSSSCKQIVNLCKKASHKLIIPAFCFGEAIERIRRREKERKKTQVEFTNFRKHLTEELTKHKRTIANKAKIERIDGSLVSFEKSLDILLVSSNQKEETSFEKHRKSFLKFADIIPFTTQIISDAEIYQNSYSLTFQDAIVYSSVISHVKANAKSDSYFLNKNVKDFENPDIKNELRKFKCKFIPSFDNGYRSICKTLKIDA